MTDIAFLGLGIMGAPMAGHLIDAGHKVVTAIHRTPAPQDLVDKGLEVVDSAKEAAAGAEVIVTIVPDTPQVEEVLFGAGGVAEGLSRRQDGRRHEFDLADRDQGVCQEDQRFGVRLSSTRRYRAARSGPRPASLTIMVGGPQKATFDSGQAAV